MFTAQDLVTAITEEASGFETPRPRSAPNTAETPQEIVGKYIWSALLNYTDLANASLRELAGQTGGSPLLHAFYDVTLASSIHFYNLSVPHQHDGDDYYKVFLQDAGRPYTALVFKVSQAGELSFTSLDPDEISEGYNKSEDSEVYFAQRTYSPINRDTPVKKVIAKWHQAHLPDRRLNDIMAKKAFGPEPSPKTAGLNL